MRTATLTSNRAAKIIPAGTAHSIQFAVVPPGDEPPPPPPPPTDTTAPTVPVLSGSIVGRNRASLSWPASMDANGVSGYRVYRDDVQIAAVDALTFTVSGLAYSTSYLFKVSAFDLAGNESAKSTGVTLTTGADPADGAFDPRTWDYGTFAGPQAAATLSLTAPVNRYVGSTGGRPNATTGPLQLVDIAPAPTFDPTLKSQSTDLATGVTLRGAVLVEDCDISASVKLLNGIPILNRCTVDDTVSIAPAPGGLSGGACVATDCSVKATQDGTWIGDTTRVWLFERYDLGDFSTPYISHMVRSYIYTGERKCGMASYSSTFQNISAAPGDYPGIETVGTMALPMDRDAYDASTIASFTETRSVNVGDFIGAPPGSTSPTGLSGVRWQVVGTTSGDRSAGAACTVGPFINYNQTNGWTTDGGGILKFDRNNAAASKYIFVPPGGDAILLYIGWLLHGDANQMGKAHGHTLWYRCRMEGFTNAAWLICQSSNAPFTGDVYTSPVPWTTSYVRVQESEIIMATSGKMAFLQSGADPDTGDYPAFGYLAYPHWATIKDCYIGRVSGVTLTGSSLFYAKDNVRVPVFVDSEARRYQGVLDQLDATGITAMTAANGGSMPAGAALVEDVDSDATSATFGQLVTNPLTETLRELEYGQHILVPTDGRFGNPDNRTLPVFQARRDAGLRDVSLDARCWVVVDNLRDRASGTQIHPIWPSPSSRPWLAPDGSDNGYYAKAA